MTGISSDVSDDEAQTVIVLTIAEGVSNTLTVSAQYYDFSEK